MKYYSLYIQFEANWDTFNKVTAILGHIPQKYEKSKFDKCNEPSIWHLQLKEDEESNIYVDFINIFMNLLEPNFERLINLGIEKKDILIWLVYEFDRQCALSFFPKDLERLGKNGIAFNIDCLKKKK